MNGCGDRFSHTSSLRLDLMDARSENYLPVDIPVRTIADGEVAEAD
jgi:hypothetical protein